MTASACFHARDSGSSAAFEIALRLRAVPQLTCFRAGGRPAQLSSFPSACEVTGFTSVFMRGPAAAPQFSSCTSACELHLSPRVLGRAIAWRSLEASPSAYKVANYPSLVWYGCTSSAPALFLRLQALLQLAIVASARDVTSCTSVFARGAAAAAQRSSLSSFFDLYPSLRAVERAIAKLSPRAFCRLTRSEPCLRLHSRDSGSPLVYEPDLWCELSSFGAGDRSSQLLSSSSAYEATSFPCVVMRRSAAASQLSSSSPSASCTSAYELSTGSSRITA